MAVTNGQGKSWARVVATVLGGLNVLGTLLTLAPAARRPLTLVTSLLSLALAAVILWLLYRPESTRYYEAMSPADLTGGRRPPRGRSGQAGEAEHRRRHVVASPAASIAARSTLTASCSRSAQPSHGPGPMRPGSPPAATHARR